MLIFSSKKLPTNNPDTKKKAKEKFLLRQPKAKKIFSSKQAQEKPKKPTSPKSAKALLPATLPAINSKKLAFGNDRVEVFLRSNKDEPKIRKN